MVEVSRFDLHFDVTVAKDVEMRPSKHGDWVHWDHFRTALKRVIPTVTPLDFGDMDGAVNLHAYGHKNVGSPLYEVWEGAESHLASTPDGIERGFENQAAAVEYCQRHYERRVLTVVNLTFNGKML